MSGGIKCTAVRRDGVDCQAWAVRGTIPPRCNVHRGKAGQQVAGQRRVEEHGESSTKEQEVTDRAREYKQSGSLAKIAERANQAVDPALDDEVTAVRRAMRLVLRQLEQELTPAEFARMANLVFTGANTIGRLMLAQKNLSAEEMDGRVEAIAQGLDLLADEWNLEL